MMIEPDVDEDRIAEIEDRANRGIVVEFLANQGGERDFGYVLNVTSLVERVGGIDDVLASILDDETFPTDVRFNAFYALAFYHYKAKNISKLETLHREYGPEFEGIPFYRFLYGIFLRERGDDDDLRKAVRAVDAAVEEYRDNPGVLKGAANTYLTAIENEATVREDAELLEQAEEYVNRAIDRYPEYPEYYVDLGRVYQHREAFDRAERAFERAIDLESKEKDDYAMRIAEYQYRIARAQLAKVENRYEREVEAVHDELDAIERESHDILREFQGTVIQTLSFFGGLIALIVTFVQVSLTLPLTQAAQLVTILMGSVIVAFGGLSVILPARVSIRRVVVVYATGLTFVAGAAVSILLS